MPIAAGPNPGPGRGGPSADIPPHPPEKVEVAAGTGSRKPGPDVDDGGAAMERSLTLSVCRGCEPHGVAPPDPPTLQAVDGAAPIGGVACGAAPKTASPLGPWLDDQPNGGWLPG
mmetsp:Transcript_7747/g.19938  ORF Transcript_7747/g.19938 Transcript_7747/m.19938 type:complete len:115 (-) Transcript_7747:2834-3178(-)